MDQIGKIFNLGLKYVFEPGLNWAIDHPILTVVAVAVLVYVSVRNYRML